MRSEDTAQPEASGRIVSSVLAEMGETFAAGFFEAPDAPPVVRMSRAIRRHLEEGYLPSWKGHALYPSGSHAIWETGSAVTFNYSASMRYNQEAWTVLRARHADPDCQATLDALDRVMAGYYRVGSEVPPKFRLGGDGYTHSILNYGRVVREGLSGYAERVSTKLAAARTRGDAERMPFYMAMEDVLAGIAAFHRRILAQLRDASGLEPESEEIRQRLVEALCRVPFQPAQTFYEALVATNVLFYLDGCDSLGRFDQDLGAFYDRDIAAGRIGPEEAERLVRLFWENVDANSGWNVALGGSASDGSAAYNALTLVCLRAAKSIRRPNLALRIRRDMPEEVFDAAMEVIASGCGMPALYNEEAYLDALRGAHLGIREEDLSDFAFGGCTETMVHGKSNVGSLDAGINLPEILCETLGRHLSAAPDFEALVDAYKADVREAIGVLVEGVNRDQERKGGVQPQPLRSLLVDDCIETGREFNDGGARYNWSVINVGGLANVVDSMVVVRRLIYEQQEITGSELWDALSKDFRGCKPLLTQIEACPRFGNDDPAVDGLAAELSAFVFKEFGRYAPWRGGKFLAGCLMFVTYAGAGENLMATPDGRRAGMPIADSAGPVQGRDRTGPTAMIHSVTRLSHRLAPGTLVVNARFSESFFQSSGTREKLKGMIRTYFELGGMQLQINVVDQAVLKDAIAHPERHEDLIVRIGGFSEYFNRLSPLLKQSIVERTEH
ncbi:MAG: pyruvate formate lyase family protein [Candidatus Latescibacterota bacterium]